ncbi:hypothetical protein [Curtobacterium sp. MCSS17_016]|uniref:hypothetical protein n=1 Tax=Curtobacterium sp. MCSS17_016 TaxID=2175644 RepID=UPI0011B68D72|nr:hypothetical protein [Curtobacterium sp. MCSS17_016]WIE81038.1 hypothetical protein DEJ19_021210 [Curtobacterium sp. MCSS17_016]
MLFGAEPRQVETTTADTVHITIGGHDASLHPYALDFAPGMKLIDPLGRLVTVVREVEPAPTELMTRAAVSGVGRAWIPTFMLSSLQVESEATVWGVRNPGGSITWSDEDTARHAASQRPNAEVLTITGRPTVVDRSPAAGQHALVDLDELRRAVEKGPSAVAALIGQLENSGDFLTDVEEALGTPGGISRLIADHRGTTTI